MVLAISAPVAERDLRCTHCHRPGIAARRRGRRGDDPAPRIVQRQRPQCGDLNGAAIACPSRARGHLRASRQRDRATRRQHHFARLTARPRLRRGGDPARAVRSGAGQAHAISHSDLDIAALAGPGGGAGDLRPAPDGQGVGLTVTEPPGPDCGPVAEAAIWVRRHPGRRAPAPPASSH